MKTLSPSHPDMDDLLMQFKAGQPAALDKVYNLFAANLLYTAKGIVKNEQEAEDIVLDAFHKCWNKRTCFESLQKIKCYLYVVIKHACFHYVDQKKSKALSHKELGYLIEDREEYALQRMIKAETIQRIYGEIAALPEKARNMLTMLYINGWNTSQISEQLKIPAQHVRVNKSRALHQLRQALSDKYVL